MWLLNARTLELELFYGESVPEYAILSHRWRDDEVLHQDLTERKDDPKVLAKAGHWKIRKTCELALADGLSYAWVDTCCIDKSSSAELSEAINSMFLWYWRAAKCYAYLDDVEYRYTLPDAPLWGRPYSEHLQSILKDSRFRDGSWFTKGWSLQELKDSGFMNSSWFTRGWTLQELLAPRDVDFYDKGWTVIGFRQHDLSAWISQITKIDRFVLDHRDELKHMSVAKRMSWAAQRETTRIEDRAYSLLGIFSVNMPLLYGEEDRAFMRLQQEIIRTSTDQSILTWCGRHDFVLADGESKPDSAGILATSPSEFASCRNIVFPNDGPVHQSYNLTNAGLRMRLPVLKDGKVSWGILNCQQDGLWLGVQLERVAPSRLHETKKLLEKDLNAYAILPIRAGSHTKYMNPAQTQKAALEDVIIIARSDLSRTVIYSPGLMNLRFISCYTSHPKTHYEIVEVMPSDLWNQPNVIQPANPGDYFAAPFRPATKTAIGSIILEDAASKHCIAVIFSYDATRPMVPFLELSEKRPLDWDDLFGSVPKRTDLHEPWQSRSELVTARLEVRGLIMTACLKYQTNANGHWELELRLKESSGLPHLLMIVWSSDIANRAKAKASQLFGSAANVAQSTAKYGRAKQANALSVRSRNRAKAGTKLRRKEPASNVSSASIEPMARKDRRSHEDVQLNFGFYKAPEQ